jgi:hypothetical protein
MAVGLSVIHAGRALPPGEFLVLIFIKDWINLRAIVRLKIWDKFKKNVMT